MQEKNGDDILVPPLIKNAILWAGMSNRLVRTEPNCRTVIRLPKAAGFQNRIKIKL